MALLSKAQLVEKLERAATKIKMVRERAALVKDQLSQTEPSPIQTAQSVLPAGAVAQGQPVRTN